MRSRSSIRAPGKAAAALAALALCACAALTPTPSAPQQSAVVTGIASGRASVAGEKSYVLRTPTGRVYFISQVLAKPLKEGDTVELELAPGGARIREK